MFKSFYILLAIVLLCTGLCTQSRSSTPEEPLRIAYSEYMPFYFQGTSGEHRGILVDFWNMWSKKTGIPVSFKTLPWKQTIEAFVM